ncbi:hypothetical protein E1301_Tti013329 [Triplophysa tibetana]|uniref:Uncharacterized protein n=1 Tax=Triplophysa tibetana TaxID=1572043 RepID=A0A5A9N133_9TELE|nr:hypothetical protein E1301_Tti013329 [Triplophysa tibetana]
MVKERPNSVSTLLGQDKYEKYVRKRQNSTTFPKGITALPQGTDLSDSQIIQDAGDPPGGLTAESAGAREEKEEGEKHAVMFTAPPRTGGKKTGSHFTTQTAYPNPHHAVNVAAEQDLLTTQLALDWNTANGNLQNSPEP